MTNELLEDLDPIALEVYDVFRRMPGEALTVETLCTQTGYDADEVQAGLQELLDQNLIVERGITDPTYILSDGAPEL